MKTPAKAQLIQNQLRQIDTFSRWVIQEMATIQRCEQKDIPSDYHRGQLCGFQLSIAIIASDLGHDFATHTFNRKDASAFPKQEAA